MSRTDFFSGEEFQKIRQALQQSLVEYERSVDEFWNNLDYEDQLRAFYAVSSRIYKGEVEQRQTYRGVLYDVFNFDADAYALGMDCRYMDLHNLLFEAVQLQASAKLKETSSESDDA